MMVLILYFKICIHLLKWGKNHHFLMPFHFQKKGHLFKQCHPILFKTHMM